LRLRIRWVGLLLLMCSVIPVVRADDLDDLARDFWAWRAAEMPVSTDDIPRLERPTNWVPDWSPAALVRYRRDFEDFEARWKRINVSSWPVSRQIDYRLMGSAISRIDWELNITRNWERSPAFYLDQTLGAYYLLLLPPPPFTAARSRNIVETLRSIPRTLQNARENLKAPVGPFAQLAINELAQVRTALATSVRELQPLLDNSEGRELSVSADRAVTALESYRDWLVQGMPQMGTKTDLGRDAYVLFLKHVALLPYTPEQMLDIGRQEWARAVAFQTYEEHHNQKLPELALAKDMQAQIAREEYDELAVSRFLEDKDILSIPSWLPHYAMRPMPAYLKPLADLGAGEADDFTSPSRLKENSTRYVDPPSPTLGYFSLSIAKDPRGEIVHEGIPGHYFQLALSWAQPDFIRQQYYDSNANEGIGFYAEEMMMEAGLFDDRPRSREMICNFARLRALRVEVDVQLALGNFTIEQAAKYLESTVPMDSKTAHTEAAFFASTPGQAISYQMGKVEILKFLAEARRRQGKDFRLRAFHDFLWVNGNVPVSLQRWEYLGLKDEIEAVDATPAK